MQGYDCVCICNRAMIAASKDTRQRLRPRGSGNWLRLGRVQVGREAALQARFRHKVFSHVHPSSAGFPGPVFGHLIRFHFWYHFFSFSCQESGPTFGTGVGSLISELLGRANFGSPFWEPNFVPILGFWHALLEPGSELGEGTQKSSKKASFPATAFVFCISPFTWL